MEIAGDGGEVGRRRRRPKPRSRRQRHGVVSRVKNRREFGDPKRTSRLLGHFGRVIGKGS